MPAPSARTKPSRSRSNGRLARVGSSLRVEKARIAANPPRPMWVIAASLPPVIMTSAQSDWISLKASPIALVAEAQAVATAEHGPCRPQRIETWPLRGIDHQLGDRERADPRRALVHHRRVLGLELVQAADSRADDHAARIGGERCESRSPRLRRPRCSAAMANCAKRSRCRGFLDPEAGHRVPVAHLAAEMDLELGRVEERQRPDAAPTSQSADQNRSSVSPSAVTTPIPVMTTRRMAHVTPILLIHGIAMLKIGAVICVACCSM